ncbi:hypothetical protein EV715DRAFT_268753 [Schizophyllum commune]
MTGASSRVVFSQSANGTKVQGWEGTWNDGSHNRGWVLNQKSLTGRQIQAVLDKNGKLKGKVIVEYPDRIPQAGLTYDDVPKGVTVRSAYIELAFWKFPTGVRGVVQWKSSSTHDPIYPTDGNFQKEHTPILVDYSWYVIALWTAHSPYSLPSSLSVLDLDEKALAIAERRLVALETGETREAIAANPDSRRRGGPCMEVGGFSRLMNFGNSAFSPDVETPGESFVRKKYAGIERQLQHTFELKKVVSFCLNLKTTLSPNFNLSHVTIVLSEIHTLRFVPLQVEPRPDTLFPTKLERSRENWRSMDHHGAELGGDSVRLSAGRRLHINFLQEEELFRGIQAALVPTADTALSSRSTKPMGVMDFLDASATDEQDTPTLTVTIDPELSSQTLVNDPDNPVGAGLLTAIEALEQIFDERNPSSWEMGPLFQILARSRPACKLAALEDFREPVQSVISVGVALDGLWGVIWKCLPHSLEDRAHLSSLQPRRATVHLGEVIANTPISPGGDVVLSRFSLRSFHRGSSFVQTAVPDTRTLFMMAATNAHLLHVIPIIDPDCFQRLSPTRELRSCSDSLHYSDLMGKVNDLRWTMQEAQTRWREYSKKIIVPPTLFDRVFRFLCSLYRVFWLFIVLIHLIITVLSDSLPAWVLLFVTIYMDTFKTSMRAVLVDPESPYNMQSDVAKAIYNIREQLDGVADAFEVPLRILSDIVDAEHNKEAVPSIEDKAQKDRALLDFMLNFDLNTGGRIQRHCQEVRSKLEDLIEDRRVEHRHRSPLQVVYEYFMPPVRSSVIPGPVGNALQSILV